jgi:hypothetical protein
MTEADWLACDDPVAMVEFLRGSPRGQDAVRWSYSWWRPDEPQAPADRRFRLFACACCRRVCNHIPERGRDIVVAIEEYLDGRASSEALGAAFTAPSRLDYREGRSHRPDPGAWVLTYLVGGFNGLTAGASALMVFTRILPLLDEEYGREARNAFDRCVSTFAEVRLAPFRWPEPVPAALMAERVAYADLLRCIFGNPFHQPTIDPSWRSETAVRLALQQYESRDFSLMPIMGDALQDAGCGDEHILNHCRSPGVHVRGCFVVDLVLGKG